MKNSTRKKSTEPVKKSNKKKWFFLSLGLVATGVLTFFGIKYYKKHKEENLVNNETPEFKTTNASNSAPKSKPKAAPKKATPKPDSSSKNSAKPGAAQSKTNTSQAKGINASLLAKAIHAQVLKKDFKKTFDLLKGIKNTKDYSAVNKVFSSLLLASVRQTLVNGLLNTFKVETQKQALRKAFIAMGLKFDGKKWSLSGIDDKPLLITIGATSVWRDSKTSVPVPINMVLGREVAKRGNHTMFENDKQYFLVESKYVNQYKS